MLFFFLGLFMATGTSGKLAQTTFETTPDDKLAAVDVYESESSGVENSFQDTYHQANSGLDDFASLGQSALGSIGNLMNGVKGEINAINSVLNGIMSGNLGSLTALTGGASSGLKGLTDLIRTATNTVSNITNTVNVISNLGNSLKGGLNNNNLLNRLTNNIPLAREIQNTIRMAGTINSYANSLEGSISRASTILGGDRSSTNTIYYGTVNKASTLMTPPMSDTNVSNTQQQLSLEKIKDINHDIASSVASLPQATQNALLRGFSDEALNAGLIVKNNSGVTRLSPQVSLEVIRPINNIIANFSGNDENTIVSQDPSAIAAIISGTTNIANKAGLKNTFTTMTASITNKNIVVAAAKPLVVRAIQEGDLDTIIDLSKSQAKTDIKRFAPDLIEQLNYNVLRPQDKTQQDFTPYYKEVKQAFERIDNEWDTYTTLNGKKLVNGCSIAYNSFLCDLIESCLNENNNPLINSQNRQNVNATNLQDSALSAVQTTFIKDSFSDELEREVDKINRDSYENANANGETLLTPPDTIDPTIPKPTEPVVEPILDFSNEPFLLLSSVFIDNSVEAEIEKHFPFLYVRFVEMGTFIR